VSRATPRRGSRRSGEPLTPATSDYLGPHVDLRLIGAPEEVDAALDVLAEVVELSRSTRKSTRDGDGRVIQYATLSVR
jgi:hypothetical protein